MYFIYFLILFPLLSAVLLCITRNYVFKRLVVMASSTAIIGVVLYLAVDVYTSSGSRYCIKEMEWLNYIFMSIEFLLMCFIVYLSFKYKKYFVALLSVMQSVVMCWLELSGRSKADGTEYIYIDRLSVIMCCIIAIVGCLICIYAVGYMKAYHEHHKDVADRTKLFFSLLFVFISAMFGIVISNNLTWMFFFWEITTFCSFMLIGYTKTPEAIINSFRALWMNLVGGICFAVAIAYCAVQLGVFTLQDLILKGAQSELSVIPVILLCVAGFIKSAQFPFSKWLLGAMVAPTPSSALLHSATMVKAGVYLLVRLSPLLANSVAGVMVTTIGGFTFLAGSFLAISQSDGKKVLAYSTIANLGLICACAGIGRYEAVWAAILLIIFHAVSKSLMFLSVGETENLTGSRNIEDMHGMIMKRPSLAFVMIIGISGMFLAPFGMLISKWAALKAFIDSDNILLIMFLVFGSAATLFYWTKWLGKLVACVHHTNKRSGFSASCEWFSMISHAVIMIALCMLFPVVSRYVVEPFLSEIFNTNMSDIISKGNTSIMLMMLCMIFILPLIIRIFAPYKKFKKSDAYMCGINTGDDRKFVDAFGNEKEMYLSNWYMEDYFGEKKLLTPSIVISAVILVVLLTIGIGGAL